MPRYSLLWKHFEKSSSHGLHMALCKYCLKPCSYKGTTSNLKAHLRIRHKEVYSLLEKEKTSQTAKAELPKKVEVPKQMELLRKIETIKKVESPKKVVVVPQSSGNRLILLPAKPQPSSSAVEEKTSQKKNFVTITRPTQQHNRDDNEFINFGNNIGTQLKLLSEEQNILAQKLISDVIFHARTKNLNRRTSFKNLNSDLPERPSQSFTYELRDYSNESSDNESNPLKIEIEDTL